MVTHGSLFNGIGGFQLAAQWMGWENVFSCEIDKFCNRVTKYHFPNCIQYGDIKQTDFTIHRGKIDILTGGFPCQDISIAGYKSGIKGERSGLFYQFIRAIDEIKPRRVIWENVPEVRKYLPAITESLAEIGYCLSWHTIHAEWLGFPHKRERIFGIYFDTESIGWTEINNEARNIEKEIYEASWREFSRATSREMEFKNYSEFLQMDNGLSKELVRHQITALGNSVVPQIAHNLFKALDLSK